MNPRELFTRAELQEAGIEGSVERDGFSSSYPAVLATLDPTTLGMLGGRGYGRTESTLRHYERLLGLQNNQLQGLTGVTAARVNNRVKEFKTNEEFITAALEVVAKIKSWGEVIDVHIGGSLAIHIYGHDLGRRYGDLDLTIVSSNWRTIEERFKREFPVSNELSHMADFKHQALVDGIKCDIVYDVSKYRCTKVVYKGIKHSLVSLKKIIRAKAKYSLGDCGNPEKHMNDIMKLINSQPKNVLTFE